MRTALAHLQAWLKRTFDQPPVHERGLAAITRAEPPVLPRVLLWTFLVLFTLLVLWAIFGRLDIVATAEGKLVPRTFIKIVQPAEAGIVKELLVREGEAVKAGQILMRMDTRLSAADTQSLRTEIALRQLQLRRIDAELSPRPPAVLPREKADPVDLYIKVAEQYRAYRIAYADSVAQEEAALRKTRYEMVSARETRDKLKNSLQYYNKQTDTFGKLGKEGFISPLFIADKERERQEKEQDYKAQEYALTSLEAALLQNERRLAQITSSYHQQLQTERIQAATQLERLNREWEKQQHKNDLLELKAAQDGIVKDIASHTPGTVVTPGTILATVVPLDEPLIAEVQLKNQDAGFVHPGQEVKVKIMAFPFQKYGMVDGKVAYLSADSTDTAGGRPEEVNPEGRLAVSSAYKTHINLKQQELVAQGEALRLIPGMQVVAEIRLGTRSVLEYLISPVQKAVKEAGRER